MRKTSKGIFYVCPECNGHKVQYQEKRIVIRNEMWNTTPRNPGPRRGLTHNESSLVSASTECMNCNYQEKVNLPEWRMNRKK